LTSWDVKTTVVEKTPYNSATLKAFRDLRDNFPPIAAGVEWHRDFTLGGGHTVQTDDPKDTYKEEIREEVQRFEREVYQDTYTMGMDKILDVMGDIALTEGCSVAEVCYEMTDETPEVVFDDYVESYEEIELPAKAGGKPTVIRVPVVIEPDWKQDLKGIQRLKIIEDASSRMRVYRYPRSGEILFVTLDEKTGGVSQPQSYWEMSRQKQNKIIKYHPWELFWLSWNQRGTNMKGVSVIQAVYNIAKLVKEIYTAAGKGLKRWADRKYFFVCGTERRPWTKESQRNFLKAMEQMIKNNYVGIPVPNGFEIKNIGGEAAVFEGKNLLDHLLGMIATGMQYPRDFLETGKTQAGDKAWLAWRVRYGRNQLQIRRAVEQQLWQRHIWCKFGKTHRIKKKGVKPSEQERKPIYVPKLEWRSEGKWHKEKEIEMLTNIQNWANPADPPLKLGVEKRIADILGMGDLDWANYDKILEIRSAVRLAEAEIEKLLADAKLEYYQELDKKNLLVKMLEEKEARAKAAEAAKGPAEAPDEEELSRRAEKRADRGVSRTTRGEKTQTPDKGRSKETGGTREPKIEESFMEIVRGIEDAYAKSLMGIANSFSEALQSFATQRQQIEINLKQQVDHKGKIEHEPIKVDIETPKLKELTEKLASKEELLIEKRTMLEEEESKRKQKKIQKEIEKLEAEKNKIEVEVEEIKKTGEKKREVMEKIIKS